MSAPTGGATIATATATGTITNDDFPPAANVFINEIHYDPAGADAGEFIEIAGLAGTDLTGWSLVLYNGNGGASYATIALSGVLGDTANGFGFVALPRPNDGIQNGAPDGIALVDNFGRVIQFLSYEGTMTATNGPAAGMTSVDIGVEQVNAAIGTSLQLSAAARAMATSPGPRAKPARRRRQHRPELPLGHRRRRAAHRRCARRRGHRRHLGR